LTALLLANLAATLLLTGLAWSLTLVQLPILLRSDYPELVRQLALHRRLNSRLMVAPMSVEFATSAWLVFAPPSGTGRGLFGLGFGLVWVVGYATVWYSLLHRKLTRGYNKPAMDRMRMWNLVRTLCWTGHSGLLLWIVAKRFC